MATSLLVAKGQYARVSGLQTFSGSIITILTLALDSSFLAFGEMRMVLIFDLIRFAIVFLHYSFLSKFRL